jgi:predicted small secreted protein
MLLKSLSLTATASFSDCHTISRAGQDIEPGGKAISDKADEHTD